MLAGQAMRAGTPDARGAHAALFERILERIHRYFRRMLRDQDAAADCLQKTMTLLEESLVRGTYQPDRSFNTWMWLKARTVFAQYCRAHARRPDQLPEGPRADPEARDPSEVVAERLDAAEILERLRQDLGDETYEAFVLYYEGGLTQEEISAALERDRKTIRKRIREAHELIDRLLGK